jgi:hypothetical protein
MALNLSDVNKKVRFIDEQQYGPYEGRLLGLTADHQIAFVEWDKTFRKGQRESIEARFLKTVSETGTENAGGGRTV